MCVCVVTPPVDDDASLHMIFRCKKLGATAGFTAVREVNTGRGVFFFASFTEYPNSLCGSTAHFTATKVRPSPSLHLVTTIPVYLERMILLASSVGIDTKKNERRDGVAHAARPSERSASCVS